MNYFKNEETGAIVGSMCDDKKPPQGFEKSTKKAFDEYTSEQREKADLMLQQQISEAKKEQKQKRK